MEYLACKGGIREGGELGGGHIERGGLLSYGLIFTRFEGYYVVECSSFRRFRFSQNGYWEQYYL